jgi:hypothetical protein
MWRVDAERAEKALGRGIQGAVAGFAFLVGDGVDFVYFMIDRARRDL